MLLRITGSPEIARHRYPSAASKVGIILAGGRADETHNGITRLGVRDIHGGGMFSVVSTMR
jgi:hypothetical protein